MVTSKHLSRDKGWSGNRQENKLEQKQKRGTSFTGMTEEKQEQVGKRN